MDFWEAPEAAETDSPGVFRGLNHSLTHTLGPDVGPPELTEDKVLNIRADVRNQHTPGPHDGRTRQCSCLPAGCPTGQTIF